LLIKQNKTQLVNVGSEDRHWLKSKRRKPKKIVLFTLIFLLLGVIGSAVAFIGYQTYVPRYHSDLSMAEIGVKHLETAITLMKTLPKNPLNAQSVNQAQREFSAASTTFVQLDNDLMSLPGVSTSVPLYGTRLSAALHLVPLAMEVSKAGLPVAMHSV
jgi:hypothetical protein